MKKDKQKQTFVNIGSSSLLMIFLVLSLVTFSVLVLSSAKSDYTLSEQLASHKREYYEASSKAEDVLLQIDQILEEQAQKNEKNRAEYVNQVKKALDGCEFEEICLSVEQEDLSVEQEEKETLVVVYDVPMSEQQKLHVALEITDYTESETYYQIQMWKVVSTDQWEGDQSIELLPMGE